MTTDSHHHGPLRRPRLRPPRHRRHAGARRRLLRLHRPPQRHLRRPLAVRRPRRARAPPALGGATSTASAGQPAWYLPNLYGNLHARQEFEFFAPVMVGDHISSRALHRRTLRQARPRLRRRRSPPLRHRRRRRRPRPHAPELPAGDEARRRRRRQVAREVSRASLRRRRRPPRSRRSRTLTTQITDDMCFKFSGPQRNYHNDRDAAKKLGFPDIVVQGMMSICFISEMMTERFGAGWIAAGKLNVNLVNIVWGSDKLTCRGFVREITPGGRAPARAPRRLGRKGRRHEGDRRHRQRRLVASATSAPPSGSRTCSRSACPRTTPPSARRGPPPSRCP